MSGLLITVAVFAGWIGTVCLHEFGHAIVAFKGGDSSVRDKGYLTLNPMRYTNLQLSIIWPLFMLMIGGIPLPGAAVYVETHRLRGPGWDSAVSAAGPAMTLACGIVLVMVSNGLLALGRSTSVLYQSVVILAFLQFVSFVLNMLPVPGLDGFGIIEPWLPYDIRSQLAPVRQYGTFILFAMLWFVDPVSQVFWRASFALASLFQIPVQVAFVGLQQIRESSLIIAVVLLIGYLVYTRTGLFK